MLVLQLWGQMRPQIYGAFVPIATYDQVCEHLALKKKKNSPNKPP